MQLKGDKTGVGWQPLVRCPEVSRPTGQRRRTQSSLPFSSPVQDDQMRCGAVER
jgi:hypothetical protein